MCRYIEGTMLIFLKYNSKLKERRMLMGILENKVCIITGAASGIGKATTESFIAEGGKVYAIDIKEIKNTKVEEKYLCDIRDYNKLEEIINRIYQKEGKIDVLFNIVGIHSIGTVESIKMSDFKEVLDVNLWGCINILKIILPIMKKQLKGTIILPGSDQSYIAKTDSCAYGVSKMAISGLTKSVALDYAKYNIRVNSICPGPVDTPMYNKTVDYILENYEEYNNKEELLKILAQRQPMGRIAKPEEIANLVTFLASDKASFMTGSEVKIDGGSTIGTL